MRRRLGLFLVVAGLVATVIGIASGCGSLFSFNGRHPILLHGLSPGTPLRQAFPAKAGRRYTLAVQIVFEREGLAESNGALVVEAQFPLVATLESTTVKTVGWIDPNEPPNVLYGQSANPHVRRPRGAGPVELVVERLVGPYVATADGELRYVVDLGPDRLAKAPVKEARVVIYDDTLPSSVTVAFVAAGAGVIAFISGTILLLLGLLRPGPRGAKRRQIV